MSGHSKWANIKHRKAAADAKKGKVFTRLIKEITVAARLGGGDPDTNPRLRLAIDKAREANMAKDSVQNAIKRGAGQLDGVTYDEARYEGYGPGGAAIMVDCLTDNRTRTVAEVRHAFTKNGGNLGADGSVSYLFRQVGQFVFAPGTSEDRVMEAGLDAGAEDVLRNDDGSVELICAPADFATVKAALQKAGLRPELAEITMKPNAESSLAGESAASLRRLLEALENLDDVQDVYTTAVLAGLPVAEYSALQVKQSVVGNGHARKQQVQHMVRRLLALPGDPAPDAADALACAICHAHGGKLGALSTKGFRVRKGRLV